MLRVREKQTTPPDGWRYRQRESGKLITATSFPNLVAAVREHRIANGYPIQMDMEVEVEEGVCKEVPDVCYEKPRSIIPERLTIANVVAFTMTLGESILKGNPRVEQEEADRRAIICSECSANVKAEGCGGCNSARLDSAISKVTRAGTTDYDNKLESCKYCGCLNRAQIWFPLDILQKHLNPKTLEALPSNCWKK